MDRRSTSAFAIVTARRTGYIASPTRFLMMTTWQAVFRPLDLLPRPGLIADGALPRLCKMLPRGPSGELMFDHVKFGVSDYAASKAFFLKVLEPLGVAVVSEGPPTYGVELSPKGKASLCLFQTEEKPAHLHLAFTAENRQQVEAFYRAARETGGKDHGAPCPRPHYHANYYAAFVIGPDGHNIEVVCHEPEA